MIFFPAHRFCLAAGINSRPFTIALPIPALGCSCAVGTQEAREAVLSQPAAEHRVLASWKGENSHVPFSVSRDKYGC